MHKDYIVHMCIVHIPMEYLYICATAVYFCKFSVGSYCDSTIYVCSFPVQLLPLHESIVLSVKLIKKKSLLSLSLSLVIVINEEHQIVTLLANDSFWTLVFICIALCKQALALVSFQLVGVGISCHYHIIGVDIGQGFEWKSILELLLKILVYLGCG